MLPPPRMRHLVPVQDAVMDTPAKVPSFRSFRPEQSESLESDRNGSQRLSQPGDAESTRRSHRDARRRDRSERHEHHGRHERHRHRHHPRHRSEDDRHHKRPSGSQEEVAHSPGPGLDPFVIDRTGDQNSARYGPSRHHHLRYSFPDSSRMADVGVPLTRSTEDCTSAKASALPGPSSPPGDDFVSLEQESPREPQSLHPPYRDPYAGREQLQHTDTVTSEAKVKVVREKARSLNEWLREHSNDVDAWLKLVHLQEALAGDFDQELNPTEFRSRSPALARVQLAVIERAQSCSAGNAASMPLTLARLRISRESGVLTSDELERDWQKALEAAATTSLPDFFHLWWQYLQFVKSDWSHFTLTRTLGAYEKAQNALKRAATDTSNDNLLDEYELRLTLDLCRFLRCAGYPERAYAILQASLELTLGCLRGGTRVDLMSVEELVTQFGQWWDSESPRVGDATFEAYHGFDPSDDHRTEVQPFVDRTEPADMVWEEQRGHVPHNEDDAYTKWYASELSSSTQRVPKHVHDVGAALGFGDMPRPQSDPLSQPDPFSYVLGSDITPFLHVFKDKASAVCRGIDAMFYYLGLPAGWFVHLLDLVGAYGEPIFSGTRQDCRSTLEVLPVAGAQRISEVFWPASLKYAGTEEELPYQTILPKSFKNFPVTPNTLFPKSDVDPCGFRFTHTANVPAHTARLAQTILEQTAPVLQSSIGSKYVAGFSIASAILASAAGEPKQARRILRSALQKDDRSLPLWYAYAQLELSAWGNAYAVRRTCTQVLGTFGSAETASQQFWLSTLWSLWVELEWQLKRPAACWRVLHCAAAQRLGASKDIEQFQAMLSPNNDPEATLASTEKLHTLRTFQRMVRAPDSDTMEYARLQDYLRKVPAATFCLFVAELLSQSVEVGQELHAAVKAFEGVLSGMTSRSPENAFLAQIKSQVVMGFLNVLHGLQNVSPKATIRPRELRAALLGFLEMAQNNTAILETLASLGTHTRIENHVRDALEQAVHVRGTHFQEDPLWLSRVLCEEDSTTEADTDFSWLLLVHNQLHANEGRVNEVRLRTALDKAIHARSRCTLLWHIAIEFELRLLQTEVSNGSVSKRGRTCKHRAKTLLYEAIRQCPYEKALYLTAFEPLLRVAFSADELDDLFTVLGEKELRTFADPGDYRASGKPLPTNASLHEYTGDSVSRFVDGMASYAAV